jgi:hypothetical protein
MEEVLDGLFHYNLEKGISDMDENTQKAIATLQESRGYDSKAPQFKTLIKAALDAGCVSVTFIKVRDGERRVMQCTRNKETIGALIASTGSKASGSFTPADTEDTIRVFDVEAKGWRSFRWETIVSFCIED